MLLLLITGLVLIVLLLLESRSEIVRRSLDPLVRFLEKSRVAKLFGRLAVFTVASVSVQYMSECGDRRQQATLQSWQIVHSAFDFSGRSLSLVAALEALNSENQSLHRIRLEKADLSGIQLPGADFRGAWLRGAVLDDANLANADLSVARLDRSIFESASSQLYKTNRLFEIGTLRLGTLTIGHASHSLSAAVQIS